jgi:hypothetical protein
VTWFSLAREVQHDPWTALTAWPAVAWSGEEARFHRPFPAMPLAVGTLFVALGDAPWVSHLALALAWGALVGATVLAGGLCAGWLVALAVPFLTVQNGWFLADIPLAAAVWLTLASLVRGRVAAALAFGLVALATKRAAFLFLFPPLAMSLLPTRAALYVLAGAGSVALSLSPPRPHALGFWVATVGALFTHLRPALWLAGVTPGGDRRLYSVLVAVVPVALWATPEHAARYALPLVPALALSAAPRLGPRGVAALCASGVVFWLGGYRPIVAHAQAANVMLAVEQAEAAGARSIEVWGDVPGTTFPPAAVADLVDFYASVPVFYGGALRVAPPEAKRHWWEFHAPGPGAPRGRGEWVLLATFDADPTAFEAGPGAGLHREAEVSRWTGSSFLFPRRVYLYRRSTAGYGEERSAR